MRHLAQLKEVYLQKHLKTEQMELIVQIDQPWQPEAGNQRKMPRMLEGLPGKSLTRRWCPLKERFILITWISGMTTAA